MNDMEIFLSGEYFIGDLHIIFHSNFEEDMNFEDDENKIENYKINRSDLYYLESELPAEKEGGSFRLDDFNFYWYKVRQGKNLYKDNDGKQYPCMSEILICFPISKLTIDERQIAMNAVVSDCQIFNFKKNFACFHNNGKVTFGDVTIDTNIDYYNSK